MNTMKRFAVCLCLWGLLCALPAWAAGSVLSLDDDDAMLDNVSVSVADPLKPLNRVIHSFNDGVVDYVARPLYTGYAYVTPRFVRTGIGNAFHNALFPVRFVNNILQGKGKAAGVEMSRFILNTTAGLGGLINVAKNHKTIVPVSDEDLGQTFGVWGMGEGIYLVLPFFGPSTLRDTVGKVGDHFLDPLTYVSPTGLSLGLKGGRTFNELDSVLDQYDNINRMAVEPYTAFRDAYIQHRRALIAK